MKRILIPILVITILLFSACDAPSILPPASAPMPEPTPALPPTPTPPSVPPAPSIPPEPSPPTDMPLTVEDRDQYATILKLTDSKGNCELHSEYNGREPVYKDPNFYRPVKAGETITIRVDVYNSVTPPVLYEFVGEGFPNTEQTDNEVTYKFTDKLQTIQLRVFVKNSDDRYRAPHFDDMIQIHYKVESS